MNELSLPEGAIVDSRNYFFFTDFSTHHELLSKMPLGPLSEENALLLAAMFGDIDIGVGKDKWSDNSTTKQWSLKDVTIIYNDKNAARLPTRRTLDFALGLSFPQDSEVPVGAVYITYSGPAVLEE